MARLVASGVGQALPLGELLRSTRTIACVGRNYAAHARELGNAVPSELFFFLKPASALTTPRDAQRVVLPRGVGEVHHEAELALVIGATARRVRREHAMRHVAGFATAIDVTGRDLQNKAKKESLPWTRAKGYDTWCPIGQLTPRAAVSDAAALTVCLSVNGQERQRGSTGLMLHSIESIIEAVSAVMTLQPGDLILTGTPAGVGRFGQGDRLSAWIEGLHGPPLELDVVEE
jgi:acylpyruvate hydrolase